MHDWTLLSIDFDWKHGRVAIVLEDTAFSERTLTAEEVLELKIPRANEWGPSVSVNEVFEIEQMPGAYLKLRLEMQSGDVIELVAKRINMPTE